MNSFVRRTFYPQKITKAIFFQLFFTFLIVASLLFFHQFLITKAENEYNYLSKNVLENEFEDRYNVNELDKARSLAEENGKTVARITSNKLIDYHLSYWTSNYVSYKNGLRGSHSILYTDNIYVTFGFTSTASFELIYKSNQKGLYISEEMAIKLLGSVPSDNEVLSLYKGDSRFEEYIEVPIAGIFRVLKTTSFDETILSRIYADIEILELMNQFYEEINEDFTISAYYDLEKPISKSDVKLLEQLLFNLESRLIYEYTAIESYDTVFEVIYIYLVLSCIAMITSIILLFSEKIGTMKETLYIQNVFYRSKTENLIGLLTSNLILTTIAYIMSLFIVLLALFIIYLSFGFIVIIPWIYYLFFVIISFIVVIATIISYNIMKNKSV